MIVADGLAELGFTSLEAETYSALLTSGPATAYRVAKLTGRPTANTYQALSALLQRGIVESDDGQPRRYRAVEPDVFLRLMDESYARNRASAKRALDVLPRQSADERIYRIENVDQLLERARQIIAGATEILLIDMFPAVVERFRTELAEASKRGVLVSGLVYSDVDLPGATLITSALSSDLVARWPGEQLTIIADASRYVTALLNDDLTQLSAAFASDSPFLACLQHSGLSAEIRLAALRRYGEDRLEPISLLNAYPDGLTRLIGARNPVEE